VLGAAQCRCGLRGGRGAGFDYRDGTTSSIRRAVKAGSASSPPSPTSSPSFHHPASTTTTWQHDQSQPPSTEPTAVQIAAIERASRRSPNPFAVLILTQKRAAER
jgi:hypothetical protein